MKTQMKNKSIATLTIVVLAALLLNYVAFFGINIGSFEYGGMFGNNGIKKGIDLAGGSVITFQAVEKDANGNKIGDIVPSNEDMTSLKGIFDLRMQAEGYTEARISSSDDGKITVEIPEMQDTDAAAELLGTTAKLTFNDADGNVILDAGTDLKSASYEFGATEQGTAATHHVKVEFNPDARQKFADATRAAAARVSEGKNYIAIVKDGEIVSQPSVSKEIDESSCVITGQFTADSARQLANQIQSGSLPVDLEIAGANKVGAELGPDALKNSIIAAAIGLLLIMIFMIVMYRLPGLIADISLLIYVGLMALIMGLFHFNLSLSGIAGIVLSIGMAVDADCIIFERVKEEMRLGKTIRASVMSGFDKAFSAIFDSNVTTIITCIVLILSKISTITGFAWTLGIGVILSMFTAIVITKFLMKQLLGIGIENRNLFCPAKAKKGGAEANV